MKWRPLAGQCLLLPVAVTILLAAILIEPVAETPASSAQGVGPASTPISTSFNLCPVPIPLGFGPQAQTGAKATVAKAVPILYRQGIRTEGFRITALYPASSTASSDYGQLVAHACGRSTQQRTYVAELVFPAMLPSASLSRGVLFLSRFERGWQVWGDYPPGPRAASTNSAPPASTTPATAEPGTTLNSTPPQHASGPIYLALGDSAPIWNGNASYPNLIAAHYRSSIPGLELVNLAVSGATTTSMLTSAIGGEGSQQQQAIAFLHAHRGHVALITIDIGGNDIVTCASAGISSGSSAACVDNAETTIATNLKVILDGLRQAAGPTVPIVGMTYYDPYLGNWLAGGNNRTAAVESVSSLVHFNDVLNDTYSAASAKVAKVQASFQSTNLSTDVETAWGKIPVAVYEACTFLDITCEGDRSEIFGDDPNAAGARVIAQAFESAIGELKRPTD